MPNYLWRPVLMLLSKRTSVILSKSMILLTCGIWFEPLDGMLLYSPITVCAIIVPRSGDLGPCRPALGTLQSSFMRRHIDHIGPGEMNISKADRLTGPHQLTIGRL